MATRYLEKNVRKIDRSKQSLTLETQTDVLDILKILDMIGAVIVKPSPDDDPDKCNYKAGLTPEGFVFG